MIMIRAIIRPERCEEVAAALLDAGYPALTRFDVYGRGKQRGVVAGDVVYSELPKELIMLVVPAKDKDLVIKVIMDVAKSGLKGAPGDGKIFVTPVDEVYTISTARQEPDEDKK